MESLLTLYNKCIITKYNKFNDDKQISINIHLI